MEKLIFKKVYYESFDMTNDSQNSEEGYNSNAEENTMRLLWFK